MTETPNNVLAGVKVVDVAINYAGPATSMYLADQGADVIKIERRITGDTSRRSGNTPFLQLNSRHFMAINRGKRSITVDIRKPDGQEIVRELAKRADVFVENFRPPVMDRLGIGYAALSAINPRLIYGSLTAFGSRGPYANQAGFDRIVQGMAGAMFRRDAEGRPQTTGVWIADWAAPMLMAFGITLALLARQQTGRGQRVESSLLQAAIAMQLGDLTVVENDPTPPRGDEPPAYNCYQCSDGEYINMAAILPHQFARLCEVLELPDIAHDERLTDPRRRAELQREASPVIHALMATRPAHEWLDILHKADVPCAPIVDRRQVPYEEQVLANDIMVEVEHPVVGPTRILGVPLRLSESPSVRPRPAPLLGEHTDSILGELGYTAERIAELRQAEVI
jgi:crotonobetainyl-CoA:carnitine CoA-transferase CaiB-like acyl-CoA transferase